MVVRHGTADRGQVSSFEQSGLQTLFAGGPNSSGSTSPSPLEISIRRPGPAQPGPAPNCGRSGPPPESQCSVQFTPVDRKEPEHSPFPVGLAAGRNSPSARPSAQESPQVSQERPSCAEFQSRDLEDLLRSVRSAPWDWVKTSGMVSRMSFRFRAGGIIPITAPEPPARPTRNCVDVVRPVLRTCLGEVGCPRLPPA